MARNWKASLRTAAGRHSSRRGAFSAGLTALVIAAVIVFNLLVAQLPESISKLDMSDNKIYTVTDTSVEYLADLQEDVAIHVLANQDEMDQRIVKFLDKYVALSDHLSLDYTDPTVYPSVLETYGCEENTIVVACDATGKQETIDIGSIIGYDIYSYYTTGTYTETEFDCEGQLTSAVDAVVSDAAYKVYQITDHGETALSSSVTDLLKKSHITLGDVNLLTDGGIPDDCDLLVCNGPTSDLADDEKDMILTYLADGGQVIYLMSPDLSPRPNWDEILGTYGITVSDGMMADTQRYYANQLDAFFPEVDSSVDAASNLTADSMVLIYRSRGMTLADPARDTITVSSFLNTSEKCYSVVDENTRTEGSFSIGALATEDTDGGTARLTVFGSSSLVDEGITSSFTNLSNLDLFLNCATAGFDDISNISIEPVSLQVTQNTITTGGIWSALFIFVLPLAVLIFGFVRWMRRRKL